MTRPNAGEIKQCAMVEFFNFADNSSGFLSRILFWKLMRHKRCEQLFSGKKRHLQKLINPLALGQIHKNGRKFGKSFTTLINPRMASRPQKMQIKPKFGKKLYHTPWQVQWN